MKFLMDMPMSPKTVKFLINMGHEAFRVSELGMAKSKDKDIFDFAEKNEMIILSADLDFGTILAFTHSRHDRKLQFKFIPFNRLLPVLPGLRALRGVTTTLILPQQPLPNSPFFLPCELF